MSSHAFTETKSELAMLTSLRDTVHSGKVKVGGFREMLMHFDQGAPSRLELLAMRAIWREKFNEPETQSQLFVRTSAVFLGNADSILETPSTHHIPDAIVDVKSVETRSFPVLVASAADASITADKIMSILIEAFRTEETEGTIILRIRQSE